jgi:hypothetical protein
MRIVQQTAHGLKANRWVVYDGTKYRLAQPGETPDGFCVSTAGPDRCTIGTTGELSLGDNVLTKGQTYGVGVDGTLSTTATAVAKATDTDVLLIGSTSSTGGGGSSGPTSFTLSQITDMSSWGRAWAQLVDSDAGKATLGIANLAASLNKVLTIKGVFTNPRSLTVPDFSGTVALLEKVQTFTATQTI